MRKLRGSGSVMLEPAARFFPQLYLLHLAGAGHWEVVDHKDVTRGLVAGDFTLAVGYHVLLDGFLSRLELDERHGDLTEPCIRGADHRHRIDRRMAGEVGLH